MICQERNNVYSILLSARHPPRQHNACRDPCKGRQQRALQRIAGLCDLRRQKVNAHSIEDCLRAAHHNGGGKPNQGIRPMVLKISSTSPVAAEEENIFTNISGTSSEENPSLSATPPNSPPTNSRNPDARKRPHRHHKADQRRHNLYDRVKTVLRAPDKILVHIAAVGNTVSHNIKKDDRNNNIGNVR